MNVADENRVPNDMTVAKDASCTTIAAGGSCTFSVSIPSEGKDYIVPNGVTDDEIVYKGTVTYTSEGEDATAETKNFNAKVSTTTTVKVQSPGVIIAGESGDFVITNDTKNAI